MTYTEGIYNRQSTLDVRPPQSVAIVGVGGVGSHVGLLLASVGTNSLVLIDDDDLEESNLNRTSFKYTQVGMKKVSALAELIFERRPECNVDIYPMKYEDLDDNVKSTICANYIVIDCRDATGIIDDRWRMPITGGYDGLKGSIHVNPDYDSIFGSDENVRYRVTPSYIIPPMLIALAIVNFLCVEKGRKKWAVDEKILSFDCSKMLDMFKKV